MLVLGLQGSPRKGGNTDTFLAAFMEKASQAGATVKTVQVARTGIEMCRGCGYCEKHGACVIAKDPMALEIYGLMRSADIVVAASPVFFYGVSAQLKGLIDRSQALWSRKYVYKLKDPLANTRKGILFSVAASKGRQLFDGVQLTAKYFFDAINADFIHTMTYRGIESKGAIRNHSDWAHDIDDAVKKIVVPLVNRKRVLFVSRKGACLAPMAASMAQIRYGDRVRSYFAGLSPASDLDASMVRKMEQEGIDMGYLMPQGIEEDRMANTPDLTITIDESVTGVSLNGKKIVNWGLPESKAPDMETMDRLYSEMETRVGTLMKYFD